MISNVSWVPKGIADPKPKRFEISPAERQMLEEYQMQQDLLQQKQEEGELLLQKNGKDGKKSFLEELRMDEYSSSDDDEAALGKLLVQDDDNSLEEEEDEEEDKVEEEESNSDDDDDDEDDLQDVPDTREYMPIDLEGLQAMSLANVDHQNTAMMMLEEEEDEGEDSDVEDTDLQPDDALVLVSKTEEDSSSLEVYVYEQNTGNLFIHHDISLPSPPLCLAHGDINTEGTSGNYCAVGMFTPGIEVWNLDVLDALEPICVLGGEDYSVNEVNKKKKKKKSHDQQPRLVEGSHTDAVMSVSWNSCHRNVIASGSADKTIKLWNITDPYRPVSTLTHHSDKVQSVLWHPSDGTLLATGSYDKTVALVDARCCASNGYNHKRVKVKADCESMAWDPYRPENLTVALEDGTVLCWDVRKFSDKAGPLWSFVAHEFGGVSDVCYNSLVPGFMATCAIDKTVALWDAHCIASEQQVPKACGIKDMAVGKLYSVSFYPSSPWLLGSGGSSGDLALWDMSQEKAIQSRFGDRFVQKGESNKNNNEREQTVDLVSVLDDVNVENEQIAEKVRNKMEGKHKKSTKVKKKKIHRR